MPDITQRYINFFEYLLDDENNKEGEYFYFEQEYRFDIQIRGALQPFRDIASDFKDTTKSYRSLSSILYDVFPFFHGILNLLKSFVFFIGTPVVFSLSFLRYCFSPSTFLVNMKKNANRSLSWLVDSIGSAIRGITQVIPLTWIRVPIRGIITIAKCCTSPQKNVTTPIPTIYEQSLAEEKSSINEKAVVISKTPIMVKKTLPALPTAILIHHLFLYLDGQSLALLLVTCQSFHNYPTLDPVWQLTVNNELTVRPQKGPSEPYKAFYARHLRLKKIIEFYIKKKSEGVKDEKQLNQLFAESINKGLDRLYPLLLPKINPIARLTEPDKFRGGEEPKYRDTFTHIAAEQGDEKLLEMLIGIGAPVDEPGGHFVAYNMVVEHGPAGFIASGAGSRPLYYAASAGSTACVQLLLMHGAGVNLSGSEDRETALHGAARRGKLDCIKLLIESKAEVALQNKDSFSAATLAEQNNHPECAQYLRMRR
jgi:hypothetical protein